ncbi:hypothetical protein [Yersinia enterocolitica]|uniref:hypothetical protein n=1 Tax=Yersinia enterocolitica TaxID=630 RepID=UPI003BA42AD4
MLSKEPVRIRRDWNVAVVGYCDFCSHSKMTVPHADGGRICASCCDSEFLSSWQNYARSLATEVLSLREQLAAINGAQEPVGFVKCDPCAEDCRWDCVDPIYLAGPVTPEGYGSDYFEVYRHPAPLKE